MNSWWIHAVPIQDPCCLSCTVQEAPSLAWCCHCCCDPRSLVKLDGWRHFCQEDLFQDLGKKWGEYPMKTNLNVEISRWTTVTTIFQISHLHWRGFWFGITWDFFWLRKNYETSTFSPSSGRFWGMILPDFQEWIQAESSRKFEKWRWQPPPLTPSLSKSMDLSI